MDKVLEDLEFAADNVKEADGTDWALCKSACGECF